MNKGNLFYKIDSYHSDGFKFFKERKISHMHLDFTLKSSVLIIKVFTSNIPTLHSSDFNHMKNTKPELL